MSVLSDTIGELAHKKIALERGLYDLEKELSKNQEEGAELLARICDREKEIREVAEGVAVLEAVRERTTE